MNTVRRPSIAFPLILIAVIGILHVCGFYLELYWRLAWYDRLVHTLGGIWVVVIFFYILSFFHTALSRRQFLVTGIICSCIVGVAWELFELKSGITVITDHGYTLDTAGDIISDIVGGVLGCVYMVRRWEKNIWNNQN